MADKKDGKKTAAKPEADKTKLDPCASPHTMETSRPDEAEEACDEGVK